MSAGKTRAMVACKHCRQRKRRCDGMKPRCSGCRERGLECVYTEAAPPRDRSITVRSLPNDLGNQNGNLEASDGLLRRLEIVEMLLGEHAEALTMLQQERQPRHRQNSAASLMPHPLPDFRQQDESSENDKSPHSPLRDAPMPHSTWALTTHEAGDSSRHGMSGGSGGDDDDDVPPITIPLGHQTSTSSLLTLPQMRPLVGDYPEDFIFRVEDNRLPSAAMDFMSASRLHDEGGHIDRTVADDHLSSFLALVHAFHPLFDRDVLLASYEEAMKEGLGFDGRSGVILAVLALGATASDAIDHGKDGHTGDACMARALRILVPAWTLSFSGNIQLSQGLILCALYFTYVVQPLTAWRLIHMASTSVQQLLIRCKDILSSQAEIQELTRLSWFCFIIERVTEPSDILAEFHQPRSGIDVLVDRMPFPNYGSNPKLEHLCVLAEISARSLLNRMHHAIYFTDSLTIYAGRALDSLASSQSTSLQPDASLLRVCGELNSQLDRWYDTLPDDIKPDLFGRTQGNRQACLLRVRYWSAKQSIFRPFVIHATSSQFEQGEVEVPPAVIAQCKVCLAACRAYLHGAIYLLSERTPYAYSSLQFALNCFLVLALAANSPQLADLVADIDSNHLMVMEVLEPWARPESSIEHALEIANSVARKLRLRDGQRRYRQ